jgi:hypothetical protein
MGSGRGTVDSRRNAMRSRPVPAATLGSTARAHLKLIVWCKDCRHQVESDPADGAAIRRRDNGARLGGKAGVQPVRQPSRQYGGERDLIAGDGLAPFGGPQRPASSMSCRRYAVSRQI